MNTKHTLITIAYFLIAIMQWAGSVILLPATLIGSLALLAAMIFFFVLGVRRLPQSVFAIARNILAVVGLLLVSFVLAVILFSSVYHDQIN